MTPTRAKDTSKKTGSLLVRREPVFFYPNGSFCGWIQGFCLVERGRMLPAAGQGSECLMHPVQVALPESDTSQGSTTIENHSHVSLGACT